VPVRIGLDGIPGPDPSAAVVALVDKLSRQDFASDAARLRPDGRIRVVHP
jgi:hypothetical protein